jgi:general secretion pathway protein C
MHKLLSRHFWVVHLLFIACAAWLASYLCIVVIQDRLSINPKPGSSRKPPSAVAINPEPYEKYSPITERNIFNPAERGMKLIPLQGKKAAGLTEEGLKSGPISPEGSYLLVGTITGPRGYSWAILQEKTSRKQQIYRIQGDIDGGKILSVSRNQIQIERQGRKEILTLSEEEGGRRTPVKAATSAATSPSKGEEVKKMSANRYLVNREDVSAAVGDVNKFMTQARLKPHFEMGNPVGYSVSEIIPGSLMEKLGLKNNDVVKKVNGMVITKPEEIMQAYAQLQRDANIEVEIERGGRSEILRYDIR